MKTYLFLVVISSLLFASLHAKSEIFFGPLAGYTQLDSKNTAVFHGASVGGIMGYQYKQPMALFARAYVFGDWSDLTRSANSSEVNVTNLAANANLGFTASLERESPYILAPYSGFAYRYIQEHRKIEGFTSYYITYKKPVIPLGVFFSANISSFFSFSLDYEYQFDIDPMVKISFMKGSLWKLKKANNQSIEAIFTFKINPRWDIQITPYYSIIKTGRSTATASDGTNLGVERQTYQTYGGSFACAYFF